MSVLEAAHATVHNDAAAETAEIASKMGLGKQVLLNKLNPNNTTHHLTLIEAVRLMKVTGDLRILHALAAEFGGVYVPVATEHVKDANQLIMDISQMSMRFGTLVQEVASDIADGQITANEMAGIENGAMDLRAALAELLMHVRGVYESQKPVVRG